MQICSLHVCILLDLCVLRQGALRIRLVMGFFDGIHCRIEQVMRSHHCQSTRVSSDYLIFIRASPQPGLFGGKRERRAMEGLRRGDSARGAKCKNTAGGIDREADAYRGDYLSNGSKVFADRGDNSYYRSTAEALRGDDSSKVVADRGDNSDYHSTA